MTINAIYRPKSTFSIIALFWFDTLCRRNVTQTSSVRLRFVFTGPNIHWIACKFWCNLFRILGVDATWNIYVPFVVEIARNNATLRCCSRQKCRHFWYLVSMLFFFSLVNISCAHFFFLRIMFLLLNHNNVLILTLCHLGCAIRPECEAQVKGFTGAIFKKFKTQGEANEFIEQKRSTTTLSSIAQASTVLVRCSFFFLGIILI